MLADGRNKSASPGCLQPFCFSSALKTECTPSGRDPGFLGGSLKALPSLLLQSWPTLPRVFCFRTLEKNS